MHKIIEPAILYFGTPVALITTENEDGTINVAPNSSLFWLGWSCMMGVDASSKTTANLLRTKQCVINLASFDMANDVNAISMLTGSEKVPLHKKLLGYRYAKNKLENTRLTLSGASKISPQRIDQCPIQMEASLTNHYPFAEGDFKMSVPAVTLELRVKLIHASDHILYESDQNKIDPLKWNPLIMSFRRFFGLSTCEATSRLYTGSEDLYAPWKMRGIMGAITRSALFLSVRRRQQR